MRGNAAALGELAIANGTVVRLFPAANIHLHLQGRHKIKKKTKPVSAAMRG